MTLQNPALLTDGGTHPSALFRKFAQSLALGNEGVDFGGDLKVRQTTTASTSILVGPGGAFVQGKVSPLQGTYYVSNPDDHTVPTAVPSVGTVQHYLVALRVEDPAYEGTKLPNSTMNSIVVVSTTIGGTALAAGVTGVVLARLEVPANTTTITSAMIVDLRKMANPRRKRHQAVVAVPALLSFTGSMATVVNAGSVDVPSWASEVFVRGDIGGLVSRNNTVNGEIRVLLGTLATGVSSFTDELNRRVAVFAAGKLAIPAPDRGVSKTLVIQGRNSGGTGIWQVDTFSTGLLDLEFVEGLV